MKNFLIGLIVVIILAALGVGGWYFFIKKSPEGGKCTADARCEVGKCVNNTCSSGKIDSACKTYNDCESGLLCLKNKCAKKPDFSQYFEKITISKYKPGSGPGPDNPSIVTTEFNSATDSIGVDIVGVKPTTIGPFYFELVNATTGETALSSKSRMETSFDGQDRGAGTDLSGTPPGAYDFNFYFNNELLYTTPITIK